MRQITTTLYKFNELSPDAQRRAWENDPGQYSDGSDYKNTLSVFEKIFDISVYDYSVGDGMYRPYFKYVKAGTMVDAPTGDALRLARYIWNNYAEHIQKGKYYSTPGKYIDGKYFYKHRYSKATFEMDNCPLTGFCADYDILQPVVDCLEYKRFYIDVDDLLKDCLTAFFNTWDEEIEYQNSFDYFAEMAEINDYDFLENGDIYYSRGLTA